MRGLDLFQRLNKGERRRSDKLESSAQSDILVRLRSLEPKGFFVKIPQTIVSIAGIPDILGCWRGHFIGIEVKRPSQYAKPERGLTASQKQRARQIMAAGGVWGIASTVKQADTIMERVGTPAALEEGWAEYRRIEDARLAVLKKRAQRKRKHYELDPAQKRWRRIFKRRRSYEVPVDPTTGRLFGYGPRIES